MKGICEELNRLKKEFDSKLHMEEGRAYIVYPDFRPHPDMKVAPQLSVVIRSIA